MDWSTGFLFGLVALIGSNHVLMRTAWARRSDLFFWGITIIDLLAGSFVLVFGLPGFDTIPGVNWLVGLVLIAHVAQNLQLRASWRQAERQEAQAERDEIRRRMRQDREAREAEEADV